MAHRSADLDEHLREVREADLEWERRGRRAEEEIRATLAVLYEACRDFSYPCGGFFEFLVDEVAQLRERVQPRYPAIKVTKRRIPAALRKRIFERDGYRCVRCGSWIDLTIDHKIPESRGGTDEDENLQTMCRPCNTSKGTKLE